MRNELITGEREHQMFSNLVFLSTIIERESSETRKWSGTINGIGRGLDKIKFTVINKLETEPTIDQQYAGNLLYKVVIKNTTVALIYIFIDNKSQIKSSTTARRLLKKLIKNGLIHKNGKKDYHGKYYDAYTFNYKKMLEARDELLLFQTYSLLRMMLNKQKSKDKTLPRKKRSVYKELYNIGKNSLNKKIRKKLLSGL